MRLAQEEYVIGALARSVPISQLSQLLRQPV
jgi:hypothetical protein